MKLFFTPQAEGQAAMMDLWWREHRPGARDLFARELAEAQALIAGTPAAGSNYSTRGGKLYRRVLMLPSREQDAGRHQAGASQRQLRWK